MSAKSQIHEDRYNEVVKWLEYDIWQLDQMVQTLSDYYQLTPSDIEQLNRFAKRTLLSMLPALLESIFIRIARLTEASVKNGHENLTLGSLVHQLRLRKELEKADEVERRFLELQKTTRSIREDHRHQRYAHLNFDVGTNAKKLPAVPLTGIQEATKEIENLMTYASNSSLN